MQHPKTYTKADFDHSPMIVFYETTRACDLMCVHCRADAQKACHPDELSPEQARKLVDQLTAFPRPPLLVLTGGDPLKRADIFDLVNYAVSRGLEVAMTPSATPLMTREAVVRLKESGLHRLAVSLDGPDARTHDGFRRVDGSFARTLEIIADARACGLPVQINTTVSRHNVHLLDEIADLLAGQDILLWSVFFLIPTGRGQASQRLSATECEHVFERLWHHTRKQPYAIKTTEAPHYRRFLLQQAKAARAAGRPTGAAPGSQPPIPGGKSPVVGTNDGRGILFVSHTGEIYPSGFLPICAGQFPLDSVVRVYQESAIFQALRDSSQLQGKCGACEYKEVCGGSRARSFALHGDPLAEEPDCAYIPARVLAGAE